jgi:two-component system, cell cycle sensor histidine kinase and response regulator CckA
MGDKEASQQILAIDPNACLIVSSGYSDDLIMAHHRAHGFRGALASPNKMNELEQLLKVVLPNG